MRGLSKVGRPCCGQNEQEEQSFQRQAAGFGGQLASGGDLTGFVHHPK